MKRLFFILLILMTCLLLRAQDDNQLNEFIVSSLKSYISYNKDLRTRTGFVPFNYYICKDGLPENFPYDSIQNATYLSLYGIDSLPRKLKKELKSGIYTIFVYLELDGNELCIRLAGCYVSRKKKMTYIGNSDFGKYTYTYSCESNKWELKEIKYGGV